MADLDLSDINHVLSLMAKSGGPRQRVVRVDAVVGKTNLLFRRAQAIAFKSTDGKRIAVGFAIDGRQSDEHEIVYERSGAARRSSLFGALYDPVRRRREIQVVRRELRGDTGLQPTVGPHRALLRLHSEGAANTPAAKIRVLSVYEHSPILRGAIENAKTRVLIVSPWIRANVVDSSFIKRLTACLNRGVDVIIAYGIGKKDLAERQADRRARESLESLAKAFPCFHLVRKGNTHAKVLLVDRKFFITTSFNWLSFRGDPSQPMREEEGTMVEDAQAVETYYRKLLDRMRDL